jgi:simple sugar transport system permease protein
VRTQGWLVGAGALLAGIGLLAMGLDLAGYDAGRALGALWSGAFGSWYAITSATLVRAVPLIVIGLGRANSISAGAFKNGAGGQLYAGAIAATWLGLHLGSLPAPLAVTVVLSGALLAGALWVAVPVLLRVRYGVLEVISTLLLNFVAEATTSLAVQGPLQERQGIYPQSDAIAEAARLPLLSGTRLHAGILIALAGAAALHHLFTRTRWGFQLRAVGLGQRAAEISGRIDSRWAVGAALAISGAIAGLAGGIEVAGVSYALFQNLSPGYGFTAIAVALLGRLHPLGVVLAGILFGALEAGASAMQREAGVPAVAVYVVEAVVILVVLLAESLRRGGMTALAALGSATGTTGARG